MIHIAVAEDDSVFRKKIEEYIERYAEENDVEIRITYYGDGVNLFLNMNLFMRYCFLILRYK